MKNTRRLICIIISLILLFGAFGCSNDKGEAISDKKQAGKNVLESNTFLVQDGKSDYAILLPNSYTLAERYAADELNYFLQQASGVKLPVVTTCNLKSSTKYISIGETPMKEEAKVSVSIEEITRNGFKLCSFNDGLVIAAPNESGLIYGVYRFLEENCNFMYYAPDVFRIDKGNTIMLKTFDYTDYPDFLNRDVYNYDTKEFPQNAMRLYLTGSNYSAWGEKYGEGSWWGSLHDQSIVFQIVDYRKYRAEHENWYCGGNGSTTTENPQLCYSTALYEKDEYQKGDWSEDSYADGRHGLFWTFVYNLINNFIVVEKDKSLFQLGMSDNSTYCDCKQCQADVAKYSRSGVAIRFANAVADEVEKWRVENCPEREIYLTMFAYITIVDPPTKVVNGKHIPLDETVVARDNLVVRYAPIRDSYMYPLIDEEHNAGSRNALLGWSAVASKLAVWDYRLAFGEMVLPFPQWMSAYENIKTYKDLGFIDVFQQGCRTFGGTPFVAMDNWVRSRLLWNVNQDYETLVREFQDYYYEGAADGIREYIDYMTMYYLSDLSGVGYKGDSHTFIINSTNFPRGFVLNVENIFKKAYAAIELERNNSEEKYQILKKRLDTESIFYRYLEVQYYSYFYDEAELTEMINEFERITTASRFLGLATVGDEIKTIIEGWRSR